MKIKKFTIKPLMGLTIATSLILPTVSCASKTIASLEITKGPDFDQNNYIVGDKLKLDGIVLLGDLGNGSFTKINYKDCKITPSLDAKLKESDTKVTFEYQGHKAELSIQVSYPGVKPEIYTDAGVKKVTCSLISGKNSFTITPEFNDNYDLSYVKIYLNNSIVPLTLDEYKINGNVITVDQNVTYLDIENVYIEIYSKSTLGSQISSANIYTEFKKYILNEDAQQERKLKYTFITGEVPYTANFFTKDSKQHVSLNVGELNANLYTKTNDKWYEYTTNFYEQKKMMLSEITSNDPTKTILPSIVGMFCTNFSIDNYDANKKCYLVEENDRKYEYFFADSKLIQVNQYIKPTAQTYKLNAQLIINHTSEQAEIYEIMNDFKSTKIGNVLKYEVAQVDFSSLFDIYYSISSKISDLGGDFHQGKSINITLAKQSAYLTKDEFDLDIYLNDTMLTKGTDWLFLDDAKTIQIKKSDITASDEIRIIFWSISDKVQEPVTFTLTSLSA